MCVDNRFSRAFPFRFRHQFHANPNGFHSIWSVLHFCHLFDSQNDCRSIESNIRTLALRDNVILHEGTNKNTFLFKMVLCQLIRISNKLFGSSGLSNFTKSTVARHFSLSHSLLTGNLRATNSMTTWTDTFGEQFYRSKIHRKTWMGSCWRRCRRRWYLELCSGKFKCIDFVFWDIWLTQESFHISFDS